MLNCAIAADADAQKNASTQTGPGGFSWTSETYRTLIHTAMDGFCVIDTHARFLEVNHAYCELIGYDRCDLLQMALVDVDISCTEAQVRSRVRRVRLKGGDRFETRHRRPDGGEVDIEVSATDIPSEGVQFWFLRDISQRKRAEAERERLLHDMGQRVKELSCMYGVARSIRGQQAPDEIFRDVARRLPTGFHYPSITRARVSFDTRDYLSDDPKTPSIAGPSAQPNPTETIAWTLVSEIIVSGKVRGAVEVYLIEPREVLDEGPFLKEERELIDGIAAALGEAIEHRQAEERIRWESEVNALLAEMSSSLMSRGRSAADIARTVLLFAQRVTDSPDGFVSSLDAETGNLVILARSAGMDSLEVWGVDNDASATTDATADRSRLVSDVAGRYPGLCGHALNERRSFHTNDPTRFAAKAAVDYPAPPGTEAPRLSAFMAVPAVVDGKLLGQIGLGNAPEGYSHRHINAIERMAVVFSLVLQRHRYEHELRRAYDLLELRVRHRTVELEDANQALQAEIVERKRATETLRKLSNAVEQSAEMVMVTNRRGIIEYVNPAFEATTGYTADEIVGQTPRMLNSGEQPASVYADLWKTLRAGKVFRASFVNRKRNGECFHVEKCIAPVRDASGEITHFISTDRDVTARRQLEQQLYQSQKMEAVGLLAGGVAHDFNNLLTAINGYCDLILRDLDAGHPVRADVEEILSSGERAATLTMQLLAFSRKQVLRPRRFELAEAVLGMAKMLRRLIGEHIELVTVVRDKPGYVQADPGQLEQVLLNLAVNGRDAMTNGGKLELEIDTVAIDEDQLAQFGLEAPGDHVRLVVRDNGCGMDEATRQRIFEPFFTTKGLGHGTGLGLATVYGIIKQTGGHIAVSSREGVGTAFTLVFPQAQPDGNDSPTDGVKRYPSGNETVLVVEDNETVLNLTRRILERHGYSVLMGGYGDEALRVCDRHRGPIHLLLSDVVMPKTSGREVAERMKARYPEIKIIFMSGYADEALVHSHPKNSGVEFIQKPFSAVDLLRQIRTSLDGGPA